MTTKNQIKTDSTKRGSATESKKVSAEPIRKLGWFKLPPEIEKEVRASQPDFASEEAIQGQLNFDCLRYYFGGEIILVRDDEEGVEVIAVGDDVFEMSRSLTVEQRKIYEIATPIPWGAIVL